MEKTRFWYEEEDRDWDAIQARQSGSLPDLIGRLRQSSQLYAERLSTVQPHEVDSIEKLQDLAFTTKNDLRDGQTAADVNQILGKQQSVSNTEIEQVISSSGTTGAPVYYGLTKNDRRAWREAIGACFFTAGVARGKIAALSTGMPIVAGGVPYADAIRETGATLVWFGGQTTARMATTLERLHVNTLIATASFSTMFADKVEEVLGRPARDLGVRTIVAGGEPGMGLPDVRAGVMERWGAERISEVMGLGDVMSGVWAECEAGEGMHFTALDDVLVELIDPESGRQTQWAEGATGELVYTTLRREATPVLRFRSRDHIVVTGMDCPCGRRTPRIRCIGRTDDMLIYKAMNVFPEAIRDVTLSVAGGHVDEVMRLRKTSAEQVRFDDPIPLEVQLRHALDASEQSRLSDLIEEQVRQRLRVRVSVAFVPSGTFDIAGDKNSMVYVASP